jgi:hypothetical protein
MRDQPTTRTGTTTTGTAGTTSYARGTGTNPSRGSSPSGGGMGGMGIGGVLSMVAGLVAFFTGLAAVVKQSFFPALPNYAYRWNVHGWGWVLLVLGALLFAAGAVALLGMAAGRIAAVGLAVLTAITGFLFLAYTPVWGTIVVALSVVAIWALLRDDHARAAGGGPGDSGYGYEYGESSMGGTGSMSSGTTPTGTTTTTGTTTGTSRGTRI